MTALQMIFIKKCAAKWAKRTRSDYKEMFQDLMQEALFAEWRGEDPVDAIRWAWHEWHGSKSYHSFKRFPYKPVFVGEPFEGELREESFEQTTIMRDLLKKIWRLVGNKARASMRANYIGAPCVWRPEVKAELLQAAMNLK